MSDSIFSTERARPPGRPKPPGLPHAPRASAPANTPDRPRDAANAAGTSATAQPSTPVVVATPGALRTPTTVALSNDAVLVSILDAPLFPGETAREGFRRKEAELRSVFVQLPVATQRALHARLSNPRAGDQLAERFARLTADRRMRLLTFLADARRREALAQANNNR